jgi:hypothetical protein
MSRNEFFSEPGQRQLRPNPQWSEADFLVDGEMPPDAFLNDVELMRSATEYYMGAISFEASPRPGDVAITRTDDRPTSPTLLLHDVLRQNGYDVALVRDVRSTNLSPIVQYASTQDCTAVRGLRYELIKLPFGRLANDILDLNSLSPSIFLPGHLARTMATRQYQHIPGGIDGAHVRRGFMTSTLYKYLHYEHIMCDPELQQDFLPWSEDTGHTTKQKLYDLFHAQGFRPYTYEELTGMVFGGVRKVLNDRPELRPASRGTEKEDEF